MKKVSLLIAMFASLFVFSCGGEKGADTGDAKEVTEATGATFQLDPAGSNIEWTGKKVAYGHSGTVNLASGKVMVEGDKITGGKIDVDMTTITNTDLEAEEDKIKLAGHLSSPDFFAVEANPTASLELVSVAEGNVTGNLTIKGITKSITFPATVTFEGDNMTANAAFSINRTDWDIKFNSGSFFEDLAKDAIIDDMIDFKVVIKGTKEAA